MFAYFSLSFLLIALSLIFIIFLLVTDKRTWKNVAHISWINSIIMLISSTLLALLFSFMQITVTDYCSTIETFDSNYTVTGLNYLYP